MNLKGLDNDEIIKLLEENKIEVKDFIDSSICPTCFDKENNNIIYGNKKDVMLYEDNDIECFLISNPRSNGHIVISSIVHYKDMMEIPDELCEKVFVFAKLMMNIIKNVYDCESVYLCTMCDGPINHFHIQLIPRYKDEKRGSCNFVKERKEYKEDKDKIIKMRELLSKNYY